MKISKILITRISITIVFLIIQVFIIAALFLFIIDYFPMVAAAIYLISILIVLGLVKKDVAAAYKVTWIVIIMALPVMGGILYLLLRNNRPLKKVTTRMRKEQGITESYLRQTRGIGGKTESGPESGGRPESGLQPEIEIVPEKSEIKSGRMAGCLEYIRRASSYIPYKNTETKYYPFGELMFEDMLAELSKAEKFIFMEYFIISKSEMWDKILELLVKKAGQGVDVRLIFDDMGSLKFFTIPYVSELRSKGIKVVRFSPIVPFVSLFMNNRDHRKIMVIDGHTGFNGGINISDEYINLTSPLGVWKDTGAMLKGDAVMSFTLMFAETWNSFCKPEERIDNFTAYHGPVGAGADAGADEGDGIVAPYGVSPFGDERLGENIYIEILNQARQYVYIFTPYLIISEKMVYALQMAAKRGVDVRIVTPGIPDKRIIYRVTRSYYRCLLEAGVRIYEYSPGFIHAKNFVSDDEIAVVGTINLDYRSLYLHFECATLLYNSSAIKNMKEDAVKTIAEGREILPHDKKRFWNELLDAALNLFAPLM